MQPKACDETKKNFWPRLRDGLRHAFAIGETETLTDDEKAVLDRAAALIARKRLALPATMLLESSRPLSFLASQGMVFLRPVLETLMKTPDFTVLTAAMEKRISVDYLLSAIDRQQQHLPG